MVNSVKDEPIAIIGMNCQFPGIDADVEDVNAFFKMLMQGQTPIKEVPEERWDIEQYYDVDRKKADKIISRKGGFLSNPHLFDATFFKISSAEAKQIDPQQRLFLEVAIRALNHANITLDSLKDSNTGVYCGISTHEYSQLNYKDNIKFNAYTSIGVANSAAAGRLSHFLNLNGPSMAVDTACSSSLSALYLAVNSLRMQQSRMAIVGGVHLGLCPESFIALTKAGMLSAAGQCSSFDKTADGFVRSEGCGVVIVKRLSDALRDKNRIYAVIKSIVMNQDGDGTGLAAPNINAQIAMHQAALEQAHVTASDIDYIEAHGTGTLIGDPVEFNAIQYIHQGQHSQERPLVIGALKSNLGHSISSSGMASLIKVLSALQQEVIPPNLHYSTSSSAVTPEHIPALLPVKVTPFTENKNKKRIAQVSNFSFTGTNVSIIVEEPPAVELNQFSQDTAKQYCFVVSANSEDSLKHMLADYVPYLQQSSASLRDMCFTLINCRDHYKYRCALMVMTQDELIKKITTADYELHKVVVKHDFQMIENEAQTIYESYLAGENINLADHDARYSKVDLPLYYFDRKAYWHESRSINQEGHWLDVLYLQSKEQQLDTIKTKLSLIIQPLLKKENINEHQDFESSGFTKPLLETLQQNLHHLLEPRCAAPSLLSMPCLTLDKLARHLQLLIIPEVVFRQPSINVLNTEPIAIIGMSCRYPKAPNIDEFLSLLEQGESGMVDIPLERWDNEKFYDADLDALGRLYIKQLGLINNVKNFDADFFNISPREAKLMSPQLRVFMETSYHALEHANLSLNSVKDSNTGVFVGCGTNEYPSVLAAQGVTLEELNIYFATGNVLNALAGRVAYAFDFHGPIQAIDTACSSSMTAIHNACLSLQAGDCNMAIAGGVNILLVPSSNVTLSKARMLSPESRCKTFSEDADGYARSEGCGVVVLKRLSDALRNNDDILAVIKGTSINSDGKSGGFTVPNGVAQEEVIRSALAKANLSPGDIDYIEAHGTGTPLADPIEANAVVKIFSDSHSQEKPLYLSSVKTNIGHSESASGVAGVIKAVLSIHSQQLFKHLNFKKLNPEIELKNTVIPLNTMEWHKENGLRCAGVSSFGFSGANAHLILQEAPRKKKEIRALPQESLLVLSAKSNMALELLLQSYKKYLANTAEEFADICYTAATCRSHFLFRVAIVGRTAQQAAAIIEQNQYQIYQIRKEKESNQQVHTLEQLQSAYQDGWNIDWFAYYQSLGSQFIKVKLPLYEFVPEEHWFEHKDKLKDAAIPKGWCHQLHWQNEPINKNNRKIQGKNWLFIGDKQFATGFIARGLSIVLEGDDYALGKLDGVIFAAGLSPISATNINANIDFQKQNMKRLLALVKELNRQAHPLQLIVLTTHAIAELVTESVNLSNSSLIGFCKTLVLELPQYNTILIDLEQIDKGHFAGPVLDEIRHNHGDVYEHVIAYRENKRLVTRLKKVALTDKKTSLFGEGRYLITGGCGGLGLVTAEALLSSGARELILTSRNVDKPEVQKALKRIQSHYPARFIRTVSLDVTDHAKLGHLVTELNADGLLKGIIHAAGAAIKAPLLEHQDKDVDYLFAAKVKGGWYLHELSQQCSLDFFVVYSSISSVFGSNKESVYSGTNSFLDALIAERKRLGLAGTAIQWGPWGDVGMAKERSRDQELKQALISNEQGHSFIRILINDQLTQASIISPEYLEFMLAFVPKPQPGFHKQLADALHLAESTVNKSLSSWLNKYLEISEDKRFKTCKDMVAALCKEILELPEMDDLDDDEGFFELGFDSLMITELATELKKKLDPSLKVKVNIGFDYPSINKLTKYIESELDSNLIKKNGAIPLLPTDDSIAIIGMSCSLPNAPDLAAFENLLEEGLSGINDIPLERWDNRKYYDANRDAPGKSYVNKLGLMANIKDFDASFFGISPREAQFMEPQQRIFLECCYTALENANYPVNSLRGSLTGVFTGVGPNEYYAQLEKSGFSNEELSAYSITGNVLNLIPGRVAYTFDLRGPSISVDTACSSSLVALHYACQSLRSREIDYAFAGGVNVLLMPESNVTLCKAKALAPDGQCKTFDERADGYVRGEGCGVVLLKRLSDALRDKDNILAIIKASAVNNDGRTAGLTVPSGKSQEEVMRKALRQTDLASTDITYIEAHGTGTPLGDPIEVHAINQVYGMQPRQNEPLYLGTVKTNIGHLESASGIAGIIKTVLSLQKRRIYKNLNFQKLNPQIELKETRIALQNIAWNTDKKLNCAAVNAFGFSGTNAHVILQEFPQEPLQPVAKPPQTYVLVLSAKTPAALESLLQCYQQYLKTAPYDFGDICFTAAICREHYPYRLALKAEHAVQASHLLETDQFALSQGTNRTLDVRYDPALHSLLTEYMIGAQVDWVSYYKTHSEGLRRVVLPNYIFSRTEFWPDKKSNVSKQVDSVHPLLGQMFAMPGNEYLFTNKLDLEHLSYINQNSVFDKVIFPASAYLEAGLAAAKLIWKHHAFSMSQLNIERPFYPKQDQNIQWQVKPQSEGQYQVKFFAQQDENWQSFAQMELHSYTSSVPESVDLEVLKSFFNSPVNLLEFYAELKKRALVYAEELQILQEGYAHADSALARVTLTKTGSESGYYYHPLMLTAAIQTIFLMPVESIESATYLPYAVTQMISFQEAPRNVWIHVSKRDAENQNELCVDIRFYDDLGLLIGDITGLKLRKITQSNLISYDTVLQHLYDIRWNVFHPQAVTFAEIPELLVVAKDELKAKKVLGGFNYHLLTDVTQLENFENKNIVFLYEQEQFNELVQCCQKIFKSRPKRFILVTENAYAINEVGRVNPYHTMASSFWRSFSNELEFNKNYTVDLDSHSTLNAAVKYLFAPNGIETQLAVRDTIYVPRLKKKQLAPNQVFADPLFDSKASYLITGGTGGVALLLIEYLISRDVKDIVITSRSKCSPQMQTLIESVKEKQVSLRHYTADASNYQQMAQIIESVQGNSRMLKGVFHLAGSLHDNLIVDLTEEEIQHVLSAKMDSALILHQLTKNISLDFFVLFSSAASLLGSRRQAHYAAANGFLDGLAHLRHEEGLPALAINWGPFDTLGMAQQTKQGLQQRGFSFWDRGSMDVLDLLLPSDLPQIAPCFIHWETYFKNTPKQIWLLSNAENKAPPSQQLLHSLRQHSKEERVTILSQALCDIAADVLVLDNTEQITAQDDLLSMGMDSLMSLEMRHRIHDKLQCPTLSLSIEYFINEPNIAGIARNIAKELDKALHETAAVSSASANPDSDEIALCDFQYVFWVVNQLENGFNVGMQVQLHGKLNVNYVSQAFDSVIRQHNALWININQNIPTQTINKQGQFKLLYQDISLDDRINDLRQEFYDNMIRLVPLTHQPLVRIYLYKVNNDLHELHLVLPHIIAEDISCDIVFSQFKKNYEALTLGKKLGQLPDNNLFFDFVMNNNRHYEKDISTKVNFWRTYNKGCSMLSLGYTNHWPDASVPQEKYLFQYPISSPLAEQFVEWHKKRNLNVSNGLIAACQIVFYKLGQQKKLPIILIHSGREGSQYKSVVGLFSEYKRINLILNNDYKFIDCINFIEAQLIKTAPYQKCSHYIKDEGLKGEGLSFGQYITYRFKKMFFMKRFQESKLNSTVIDYYIKALSRAESMRRAVLMKYRLNQIFKINIPLQKPHRLRVLISVTPSFFMKESYDEMRFANLNYTFPSDYGCLDRPVGNQTLWIYFTRTLQGKYLLSINAPLTTECKDQIAKELQQLMTKILVNETLTVSDLIS